MDQQKERKKKKEKERMHKHRTRILFYEGKLMIVDYMIF